MYPTLTLILSLKERRRVSFPFKGRNNQMKGLRFVCKSIFDMGTKGHNRTRFWRRSCEMGKVVGGE
jgi:hypothetical protein